MTTDLSAPVHEVADKIKSDAGLLAKLLSVVNCPFMGLAEPVEDVAQAISLLGYKKLCNLAVAVSIIDLFPKKQEGGFDYARYWERAVTCGVAAGEIASRVPGEFPGEPFSSGVLQDLGVLFLIRHRPMDYGMSIGCCEEQGRAHRACRAGNDGDRSHRCGSRPGPELGSAGPDGRSHQILSLHRVEARYSPWDQGDRPGSKSVQSCG